MSRPRFLADHDFNEHILHGLERREPTAECVRLRDIGLDEQSDSEILEYAASHQLIVLSHDVNSMTASAYARLAAGQRMCGLILAHQRDPVSLVVEELLLILGASKAEDWTNKVTFLPL